MFDRYYCKKKQQQQQKKNNKKNKQKKKTENIYYISRYFLHYFVSPSHWCPENASSTDYARSKAGHYSSRDGSNSVAPV